MSYMLDARQVRPHTHAVRARDILKKYPEVRELFGPTRISSAWIWALVTLQLAAAYGLRESSWWVIVLVAAIVGATIEHSLFVLLHDCTHNLVAKKPFWNRFMGVVTNLPGIFPSAVGFRKYHLLHHRYMGNMEWDPDLAGPKEAAWVGHSAWRKALWLMCFPVVQGMLRPMRVRKLRVLDAWGVFNAVAVLAVTVGVTYFLGWKSFTYLLLSLWLSIGLHPFGGRWIQEHYVFKDGQETYSYYGPLNHLAFNIGYHNEHHDFPTIPWCLLPRVKAIASEFYESLYFHTSWTHVLWKFIFDKSMGPNSRVIREDSDPIPGADTRGIVLSEVEG